MLVRLVSWWCHLSLIVCSVSAGELEVAVGQQQIVMPSGHFNLFCFPDQPISILRERPLSLLMVVGEGTVLFQGHSWQTLRPVQQVLGPSKGTDFDNGYAGIGGIHRIGRTIYALYHAEDQVNKSSSVADARNQKAAMFSVGLAVSQDNGLTFERKGQVLSSAHPYRDGSECGGLGDITVCADKTNRYLLAYYADFSRSQGPNIQICAARSPMRDRAAPGTWRKYFNGSFSEPGLGGKESHVLSAVHGDGDTWSPHLTYSRKLDRYILTFAFTKNGETDGVSYFRPKESGIYLACSEDGIHWGKPVLAFAHSVLLIKGVPGALHPTLYLHGATKDSVQGTLFYAYTPDWGTTPHHLAARPISISLREDDF